MHLFKIVQDNLFNTRQLWKFRVRSTQSPLVLGMCVCYKLLESSFKQDLTDNAQGLFAISSIGEVYNHKSETVSRLPFKLQEGDLVAMLQNSKTSVLTFSKLGSGRSTWETLVELDIYSRPQLICLPCIGLGAEGDSVEIVFEPTVNLE